MATYDPQTIREVVLGLLRSGMSQGDVASFGRNYGVGLNDIFNAFGITSSEPNPQGPVYNPKYSDLSGSPQMMAERAWEAQGLGRVTPDMRRDTRTVSPRVSIAETRMPGYAGPPAGRTVTRTPSAFSNYEQQWRDANPSYINAWQNQTGPMSVQSLQSLPSFTNPTASSPASTSFNSFGGRYTQPNNSLNTTLNRTRGGSGRIG